MIEIKTKLQRWGNSFGVVVPVKAVRDANIKEGEEVNISVNPVQGKPLAKELFGKFKTNKSTDEIMSEIDRDLDSEF